MPLVLANIFQPLIDAFDWVIVFFHDSLGLGWGMAIIALTVVVRLGLLPLTIKQFKSMAALQRLTPQIKELQAKYKDDRQRLNQEMMKFYQENKVNPFGSCLPLLLQLPVFLALFYMLRQDLKMDICGDRLRALGITGQKLVDTGCDQVASGSAAFGFIPDLTFKATGGVLATLLVLYVGSQLASSVLMSVSADRNQRFLLIALPFLFVPFIQSFPAGLVVYWITTNLWTVGQQYFVRRYVGHHPVPAVAGGATATSGGRTKAAPSARGAPAPSGGDATAGGGTATKAPPQPPRKKKKRSGRRR
jgi:YidC/Oxa1 family membrane protein insertase